MKLFVFVVGPSKKKLNELLSTVSLSPAAIIDGAVVRNEKSVNRLRGKPAHVVIGCSTLERPELAHLVMGALDIKQSRT